MSNDGYTSFEVDLPPHRSVLLVRSTTDAWQGDLELYFDAHFHGPGDPALVDGRLGRWLWYPERMEWKLAPRQPDPFPDDAYFADDPFGSPEEQG